MISGDRAYRSPARAAPTYLGMQVLAGTGLNPRRMSNHHPTATWSRRAGPVQPGLLGGQPAAARPQVRSGMRSPTTRRRSWCATSSPIRPPAIPAQLEIELLGKGSPAAPLTDDVLADQLTAMG